MLGERICYAKDFAWSDEIMKRDFIVTFVSTLVLLLFFVIQGAVVVVGNITGTEQIVVQGSIIWIPALIAMYAAWIKDKKLRILGFKKLAKGSAKTVLYYIPFVGVAILPLVAGVDFSNPIGILARLYMTLAIGCAEEIYFRGIIFNTWSKYNIRLAVIVSAALFGLCHILNLMGGAGVVATLLQICFAFVWGMAISFVFYYTRSIYPGIILHMLHDFCSFISKDVSGKMDIVLGAVQFCIMVLAVIYFWTKSKKNA